MAKNGFSMSNRVAVETVSADKTLTADDCGKVFIVGEPGNTADGATIKITLPAQADAGQGWNATFVMESGAYAPGTTWSGSADDTESPHTPFNLRQISVNNNSDIAGIAGAAATFTIAAGNVKDGDRIEILNASGAVDGYKWSVKALTSGSISLTP